MQTQTSNFSHFKVLHNSIWITSTMETAPVRYELWGPPVLEHLRLQGSYLSSREAQTYTKKQLRLYTHQVLIRLPGPDDKLEQITSDGLW